MDALVDDLAVIHADIADKLVPGCAIRDIGKKLDASQEVVDCGQIAKGIDGPECSNL